jgi:hypothetical protein
MDNRELEELKWSQYKNRPSVKFEEEDDILKESLDILEKMENRFSRGTDVINWEEKAELDKATQRNPGISVTDGGEELTENKPEYGEETNENIKSKTNNSAEQELMNDLAGIMGQLEGYDDKQ